MNRRLVLVLLSALAVCAPVGSLDSEASFLLHLAPLASIPLGADAEFFTVGGGADLAGYYLIPGFRSLGIGAGLGYSALPLRLGTSASVLAGSIGTNLTLKLSSRLHTSLDLHGGYWYGFLNNATGPSSGFPFLRAAAGIGWQLNPSWSVLLAGGYRAYFGFYQGIDVGLGARWAVVARDGARGGPEATPVLPLAEAEKAEPLQIRGASFGEVFPVFYKYYDNHPLGSAVLVNNGTRPVEGLKVRFFVKQYMDNPTVCGAPVRLEPGEEGPLELYALFSDTVLRITESTKVSAEISVDYSVDGRSRQDRYAHTIRLYDRNATTWADDRRAAAFVTAKDPAVLMFAKSIAGITSEIGRGEVNPHLRAAMALHSAFELSGLSYVVDPRTPYKRLSEQEQAVDYLQFPRQTLQFRGGDCDDLSILWCAVLEAVGVETAFLTIPGHILPAFSLNLTPGEAKRLFQRVDDLIIRESSVWVPVEATQTRGGLLAAWEAGARQWREAQARDQAGFYPIHEAWELYEPVGLPESEASVALPDFDAVSARYRQELSTFVTREIYPRVGRIEAEIAAGGESASLRNQLGILYARYGILDRAEREFQRALELDAGFVPALVNMGNLRFMTVGPREALPYYENASALSPDNPAALVGLARASHEIENYGTVNQALRRLKQVAPEVAQRFAYLELRGMEAERASAAARVKDEMIWDE